jgi:hypothetical protein
MILTRAQLGIGLRGIDDHPLLEALNDEHLQLDHIVPAVPVEALPVA